MEATEAAAVLEQLRAYTIDVAKFHGVPISGMGRNSYGEFGENLPNGFIFHYTASPRSKDKKRPYGRGPTLLNRFRPGSDQGVGVQFIIMDEPHPRLQQIKDRYDLIKDIPAEVYYMGGEAFWHAGSANRWAWGAEIRNVGQIQRTSRGQFRHHDGKHKYVGREPIKIGKGYWEPYTKSQIMAAVWILRLTHAVHEIEPYRVLGHTHVTNTRIDPGLHFPIHSIRSYGLHFPEVPFEDMAFLKEFRDGAATDREDVWVSEEDLAVGLYRHDWDGDDPEQAEVWAREKREAIAAENAKHPDRGIRDARRKLQSLGYWPGSNELGVPIGDYLEETLRIFQGRWKVKKGRRWVHDDRIPVTGRLDEPTLRYLDMMTKMVDRM